MAEETPQISYMDKITNNVKQLGGVINNAIEKLKNLPKANIEAGIFHLRQGNFYDASMRFKIAAWMDKNNYIAHYLIGKALVYDGKRSKAIKPLKKALSLMPNFEEAKFLLAVCGSGQLTELPRSFIIERNDILAQNYEAIFRPGEETNFRTKLKQEFATYFEEWQGFEVLDLGCMGGDAGELVRAKANHSIKISAFAKTRRLGDSLVYNKVSAKFPEDYLAENEEYYQVMLSAFYVTNFADPTKFFRLVRQRISKKGGAFIFIINPNTGSDYKFSDKQILFMHSEQFIEKCLTATGFTLFKKSEVKFESGNISILYIAEAEAV